MKKFLIISSIILLSIFLLFFALTVVDNVFNIGLGQHFISLNKEEEQSREKIEEFLSKEFKNYEIKSIKQITDTEGFGTYITPVAKCEVKIDGENYLVFYDSDSNEFFSNFYYKQIFDEAVEYYRAKTPKDLPYEDIIVSITNDHQYTDDKLVKFEDKTFKDVLNRNKTEKYSVYNIHLDYYLEKNAIFSPKDYEIEKLFEGDEDTHITILKADEEYKTIKNELYVRERYEYTLFEENIIVHKTVNEKIRHNNAWIVYDKDYLNVEIVDLDENDVKNLEKNLIKEVPINSGFKINAHIQRDTFIEEYDNCIGTKTKISYTEHVIRVMFDKETYLNTYLTNENTKRKLMNVSVIDENYFYDFVQVYSEPVEEAFIFTTK